MDDDAPVPGPCRGTAALATAAPIDYLEPDPRGDRVRVHLTSWESQVLDLTRAELGEVESERDLRWGEEDTRERVVCRGDSTMRFGALALGGPGIQWTRPDGVHLLRHPGEPGRVLGLSRRSLATLHGGEVCLRALPDGALLLRRGAPLEDRVDAGKMDPAGRWLVLVHHAPTGAARMVWWDLADLRGPRAAHPIATVGSFLAGPLADGRVLLSLEGPEGETLAVLGPEGPGPLPPLPATQGATHHAWSLDGRRLLRCPAGSQGGDVWVDEVDLDTGARRSHEYPAVPGQVRLFEPHVFQDGTAVVAEVRVAGEGPVLILLHRLSDDAILCGSEGPRVPRLRWFEDELWGAAAEADGIRFFRIFPLDPQPNSVAPVDPDPRIERFLIPGLPGLPGLLEVHPVEGFRALDGAGGRTWCLPGAHESMPLSGDLSPDGQRVVALYPAGQLLLWTAPDAGPTRHVVAPSTERVRFGLGGRDLLLQREDGVDLFDGRGPPRPLLVEEDLGVPCIEVDHDAGVVIVGGPRARLWTPTRGVRAAGPRPAWTNQSLPGGGVLSAGLFTLWLRPGPEAPPSWRSGARPACLEIAVDAGGRILAVITEEAQVELVDPGSGDTMRTLAGQVAIALGIAFERDERWLWAASLQGGLLRWDLEAREPAPERLYPELTVTALGRHHAGGVLVGTDEALLHVETGPGGPRSRVVARLPAGAACAAFGPDGAAWIRSAGSDSATRRGLGGAEGAWSPPYDPDHARMQPAAGHHGEGVLLLGGRGLTWWRQDHRRELRNPHRAQVTAATFDPAGHLYTAAADGTLVRWNRGGRG